MRPLLVTSGEPAGIGPDICLALAHQDYPIVVIGDQEMLAQRADLLKTPVRFRSWQYDKNLTPESGVLNVMHIPLPEKSIPGQLNVKNASYVIDMLTMASNLCHAEAFSAMITAPVHKAIINEAGLSFTGHTEFLADFFSVNEVVMLLACQSLRVALVTTHLPLKQVPSAITREKILNVVRELHKSLQQDFNISNPLISVAGLNPHAGENGYLGTEEIEIIEPALASLRAEGMQIDGPLSADTMFNADNIRKTDAFVAMYHDQGLPVLKYAGFGQSVNITLGLPIVRTSVDHGTALHLAGTNKAESGSLLEAVRMAAHMASNR